MTDIKKWPTLSGEKVDILKQVFLAGESMNIDNFVRFFSDDALYRFGNSPIVFGHEGIKQSSIDFLQKVEDVTYIRKDGKTFNLPACDTVWFNEDLVQKMNIYMDITPVFTET
ncbi:MAG: hypothetical protein ACK5RT_20500 [Dolichospermum sp.]